MVKLDLFQGCKDGSAFANHQCDTPLTKGKIKTM